MSTLPVLSVEESLERMAGDKELLSKLVHLFMADAPKKIEQIGSSLQQDDCYQVERTAHSLKGASATVGASRLCQTAAQVELAAKNKDLQALTPLVRNLALTCDQTLEAMGAYCDRIQD